MLQSVPSQQSSLSLAHLFLVAFPGSNYVLVNICSFSLSLFRPPQLCLLTTVLLAVSECVYMHIIIINLRLLAGVQDRSKHFFLHLTAQKC